MTTFQELILAAEVEEEQLLKARDRALNEIKAIGTKARQEGRARLSEQEDADVAAAMERHKRADEDLVGCASKLKQLRVADAAEKDHDKKMQDRQPTAGLPKPHYDRVARVGGEERTYRPDTDKRGKQFLRDVVMQYMRRDPEAEMRLHRHMQEEMVERGSQMFERAIGDAGTGAFAGLVVPQYLTDLYAPAVAALRPFADICNPHELPAKGMTVNISRITTPAAVGLQATELAAPGATHAQSMDDTLLTENVQTAEGIQTLSRQAIERGTGIEDVTLQDLFKRYATTLDGTLIKQATTGLSAIATATAYTDTTPTAPELWPKILGATAGVEAALLAQAVPTHVLMHSRRWYWLNAQTTNVWPFVQQPGMSPYSFGANAAVGYNQGPRGILPSGMPVIVDNNIPVNLGAGTNEDEIYVVPQDECHLWEDPSAPMFIRADQPAAANLGVLLVVYGYFAYSFGRYANGMGKVNGTGLVTPVF